MKWTEYVPVAAAIIAAIVALAGAWHSRRKADLDEAQATNALVNSDSVKAQIRRMSDESNLRRDTRILDIEAWADEMRPWASEVQESYAVLVELAVSVLWDRGESLPDTVPRRLPPPPKFPPPRPMT